MIFLLFAGIADAIFNVLFNVILGLINIVLLPLNALIDRTLPDVSNALNIMASYIAMLGDYISFGLSYLGFSSEVISAACIIIFGLVTIPLAAHAVKLIIKWYVALKP